MADWLGAGTSYPVGDGWILLPVDVQTITDLRAAVSNETITHADTKTAISSLLAQIADTKAGVSNEVQSLADLLAAVGNMITVGADTKAGVSNLVTALADTRARIDIAIILLQVCIDSQQPTASATSKQPTIKFTRITGVKPCSN